MDDGSQLLKALNVLMLKILVNICLIIHLYLPIKKKIIHLNSSYFFASVILALLRDCMYRIMRIELHHLLS